MALVSTENMPQSPEVPAEIPQSQPEPVNVSKNKITLFWENITFAVPNKQKKAMEHHNLPSEAPAVPTPVPMPMGEEPKAKPVDDMLDSNKNDRKEACNLLYY